MACSMTEALAHVLRESLSEWQLAGTVQSEAAHLSCTCGETELSIGRADAGMPFRWVVTVDGRRRTAASVNGVLRIVRQTLAPDYQPMNLRIAPLPAVPSLPRDTP